MALSVGKHRAQRPLMIWKFSTTQNYKYSCVFWLDFFLDVRMEFEYKLPFDVQEKSSRI